MESISLIVQKEKSRKQLAEERRNNAFNAVVENIKKELIQRGFGKEEDLGSQPAILMLVAETLNQVDLKSMYPAEARRKSEGGKMPRDTEKRQSIVSASVGQSEKNASVGQVNSQTVAPISPTSSTRSPTLSPGLPTLSPSPPLLQQNPVVAQQPFTPGLPNLLPTGSPLPLPMAQMFPWMTTPFPMVPMDPAAIQLQIQLLQNQIMLQNLINPNQESQVKEEEVAGEEPTVAPIKDEDEDFNLTN